MQVIRKPGAPAPGPGGAAPPASATPGTVAPKPVVSPLSPRPVTPRPVAPHVTPRPGPAAPRPGAPHAAAPHPAAPHPAGDGGPLPPRASPRGPGPRPSPGGGFGKGKPGGPRFPRAPSNRPPPTPEQIAALARKERVPARIAKGELEGKMKCRIWKKLHAEEARNFDKAWTLMESNPALDLQTAFGVIQSGMPVEEFLARRNRAKKKEEVKTARTTVSPEAVDGWIAARVADKGELAFVLAERTALDVLVGVEPVAFLLERGGRLEKLQVVVLARRATWERLGPTLPRDARLVQKPTAVARQPSRRPVADPRPFLELLGKKVFVELRSGLQLEQPVRAVGPFDVLLGEADDELFVPLHAMLRFEPR